MSSETLFENVKFDAAAKPNFMRIAEFITAVDGCGAYLYQTPTMREGRAAHVLPGEGRKKAQKIFLMIAPRRRGLALYTPGRFVGKSGRPAAVVKLIDGSFMDWTGLKGEIKSLAQKAKAAKRSWIEPEFGDGIAIQVGRPESDRLRF